MQTILAFIEETWKASLRFMVRSWMHSLSVKWNVITAVAGSNTLGICPRERIRNKRMHVVNKTANERHEFLETVLSASHRIRHKLLIKTCDKTLVAEFQINDDISKAMGFFQVARRQRHSLVNLTFVGRLPCLASETRQSGNGVPYRVLTAYSFSKSMRQLCAYSNPTMNSLKLRQRSWHSSLSLIIRQVPAIAF